MLRFVPTRLLGILAVLLVSLPSATATPPHQDSIAVQIRADQDDAVLGTAVLVAVDSSGAERVLFFLTSSRVFERGETEPTVDRVRLVAPTGAVISVAAEQLIRPIEAVPVVLIRVQGPGFAQAPVALDLSAPVDRGVFVLAGFQSDGSAVEIPERVQRRSTGFVTGERPVPEMDGPLGAPAISPAGVFGVVTESKSGQAPVVTVLSSVDQFLSRYLPPDVTKRTDAPKAMLFRLAEKRVGGPLLSVACDTEKTGEIDVPYRLSLYERPVDATATISYSRSVKLADLTVLALNDRTIKLRFNLVGKPPSAFVAPGPCVPGQALVTVRVNVVSFPRQE